MVAAVVGLGGGRSGAKLTKRAASGAGEEMAGGLWLAKRGKTAAAESVERDEGRDGTAGGRD